MPKEEFKREVEKELTGRETEPWEIIYFKLYKGQIPVIEQAIETAALMLGSDKSRGYCLEMICADFLAGANLDNPDLLFTRSYALSNSCRLNNNRHLWLMPLRRHREPNSSKETSAATLPRVVRRRSSASTPSRRLAMPEFGTMSNLEVHHKQLRSHSGSDIEDNLITLCDPCHKSVHCSKRSHW